MRLHTIYSCTNVRLFIFNCITLNGVGSLRQLISPIRSSFTEKKHLLENKCWMRLERTISCGENRTGERMYRITHFTSIHTYWMCRCRISWVLYSDIWLFVVFPHYVGCVLNDWHQIWEDVLMLDIVCVCARNIYFKAWREMYSNDPLPPNTFSHLTHTRARSIIFRSKTSSKLIHLYK